VNHVFVDSGRAQGIKQAYLDVLGREADFGGLENYYNSALSVDQVRLVLAESPEGKGRIRRDQQIIEMVEPWLGIGALTSPTSISKAIELGFNRVIYLREDEEIRALLPEGSLYFPLQPGETPSTGLVVDCITALKAWEVDDSRVLICCPDGMTQSPAIVWLWYHHNGLDPDDALMIIKSRVEGVSPEALRLGPWHFDAALTLESF